MTYMCSQYGHRSCQTADHSFLYCAVKRAFGHIVLDETKPYRVPKRSVQFTLSYQACPKSFACARVALGGELMSCLVMQSSSRLQSLMLRHTLERHASSALAAALLYTNHNPRTPLYACAQPNLSSKQGDWNNLRDRSVAIHLALTIPCPNSKCKGSLRRHITNDQKTSCAQMVQAYTQACVRIP